jgi:hypothetical protein
METIYINLTKILFIPIMGKYIISWNDGNGAIRGAQYDPTDPTQHWTKFGIGYIDNQSAPQMASYIRDSLEGAKSANILCYNPR